MKKYVILAVVSGVMFYSFTGKEKTESRDKKSSQVSKPTGQETFLLDVKKSKVEWVGKAVTKQHTGTIDFKSGNMVVDTKQILSGFFYIDMKTIACTDIKDPANNKQLVDHLKSDDFFSASKYETTFKILKATRDIDAAEGQVNYSIKGDLTIKGIKNTIEFPASISFTKKQVLAKANVAIDRSKWNVQYGSGSFFKDLGDKMIDDTLRIKLNIVADIK
ncbi:MAG: YceI family protein [Cytophagales bacterium]|nr:YceI family protein [Cytophagales bacterium]